MILKGRNKQMALLQRVISVLLYGNGCSKQIIECLQPFQICLSHSSTLKLVDRLSEDYDSKVLLWCDAQLQKFKSELRHGEVSSKTTLLQHAIVLDDNDEDEVDDDNLSKHNENEEICIEYDYTSDDGGGNDDDYDDDDDIVSMNNSEVDLPEIGMTCHSVEIDEEIHEPNSNCYGYKIVCDNFDKNFRRTYQRIDYQTRSCHFLHSFALQDRVNLTNLSNVPSSWVTIDIDHLLPSSDDVTQLKDIMSTLISRILVKHMVEYREQAETVNWHIHHKYYEEMKKKSVVVPLGILFLNENKVDEMCKIMESHHKYVPTIVTNETVELPNGDSFDIQQSHVREILFTGDQFILLLVLVLLC
jgi:L1 cell adhesion molecule like protein